jgi:tetratricopeptide (TPR) repeat protein
MTAPLTTRVYDALRIDYGDGWRIVPDEANQQVHHPLVRDLELGYRHYVADYAPYLPRNVKRAYLQRKSLTIETLDSLERSRTGMARLEALRVRMSIERTIASEGVDIDALVRAQKYSRLREVFAEYYRGQFSGTLRAWAVPVGLDDRMLHAALLPLVMEGDYFRAVDAFTLRERENDPLSPALLELRQLLEAVRATTLALEYDDMARAGALVAEWADRYPECVDFARAELAVALSSVSSATVAARDDAYAVTEQARKTVSRHPRDAHCMKYLADALALQGDPDEALAWYSKAAQATDDGVLLLAIGRACTALGSEPPERRSGPLDGGRALTAAQKRLLEMLAEVDELCRANGIAYFLGGNTALRAYRDRGFSDGALDIDVVMSPDAAARFATAASAADLPNRVVETGTGDRDSGALYFTDRGSLCLEAESLGLAHHGLRITVNVVRRPSLSMLFSRKGGVLGIARRGLRFASALYRHRARGVVTLHAPGGRSDTYSSDRLFRTGAVAEFEGRNYPIPGISGDPAATEAFLHDVAGVNWKRREIAGKVAGPTRIVDAHLPYAEFLDAANAAGLLSPALRSAISEYRRRDGKTAMARVQIRRNQYLAARSADRFALSRHFAPLKSAVVAARAAGRFDELRELLEPYVSAAARNCGRRLGLSFDPALLDALTDLLEHDGEHRLARSIRRRVPRAHRKALTPPS